MRLTIILFLLAFPILGLTHNAESFCESHEAFKKTIEVTEKLGMKKNPNLFNYRDLAKAQALKRLKAQ